MQLERDKLANTSGKNNPIMQDYDKSLQSMRNALIQSLVNQERTLDTQLNSLIRDDRATNRKIASSPTQAKYLLSVERQQKVMEALYLFLLQKREENELSLAFTPFNTRVITPPMGSNRPVAPRSMTVILCCILAGLIVPAVIIFITDSLDNRLRNRMDLEKVGTPLLGEIPDATERKSQSHLHPLIKRLKDFTGKSSRSNTAPPLLVREHGRSIVNEAFRML
ncbi:MAG: chromosome partitioning protein ParA, partial [Duncaniella sp.]|nr:chromosome partitioning protein ParA [Duncaniella sp.]